MIETIFLVIGFVVGGGAGYSFFRYVLKKKYLRMIDFPEFRDILVLAEVR